MTRRKFAVFDIDGTLLRWQLYHSAVNTLAKEGTLGDAAYDELKQIRMVWKRREHPDAFKEYERYMIKVYDTALNGLSVTELEKAVSSTIAEHKQQVYTYTRDLISSLKAEDYFLLAISGSHHEMVEEIARFYGFDDWIGAKYEIKDGKFTGQKTVPSEDKETFLRNFIEQYSLGLDDSVGVGDTISDAAFLSVVERPIAFNPDQKLYEKAKTGGWKIVVERKNVIYELEPGSGEYKLSS